MTEKQLREKVVSTSKQFIGCKESDGSHRRIINIYNNYKLLPRDHKMTYSAAWCATFVSAVAIEANKSLMSADERTKLGGITIGTTQEFIDYIGVKR